MNVSRTSVSIYCASCDREVELLSRGQAAVILEVNEAELNALILAKRIHAIETVSGNQTICKTSLLARTTFDHF